MRESTVRDFMIGEAKASQLQLEASEAVRPINEIECEIVISPMESDFELTRSHVQKLCKCFLDGELTGEVITTIAFALAASDRFYWEDDVMAEVIYDWSCPEVNYRINSETISMHMRWLNGQDPLPVRPPAHRNSEEGNVVSIRRAVRL